jgi:maltose O-acetyltransferase
MLKKIFNRIFDYLLETRRSNIYKNYRNKYQLHENFRFNGKDIVMYGEGQIIIGNNSYVGEYSTWQAVKGYKVQIGEGCQISHNVRCYTQTAIADANFSVKPVPSKEGDVIIGNYVWIGANVFINPGISIGDNSVIGANSVVTKDVDPFSIVGGVPARLIRYKNCND